MKVSLEVVSNGQIETRELRPGTFLRIGRNDKSNWIIQDDRMSGAHCEINLRYNRLVVTDLKSKNGTYLNGIRIEQADLFVGDQLRIGETHFIIQENLMDQDAIKILTFPGGQKERISKRVLLDFTSARLKNQCLFNGGGLDYHTNNHKREIKLRKIANTRIKLSKDQMRSKHNFEAQVSNFIDYLALILMIYLPMMITRNSTWENKTLTFIGLEFILVSLFLLLNFSVSQFTLGEQVSGIKDRCLTQ